MKELNEVSLRQPSSEGKSLINVFKCVRTSKDPVNIINIIADYNSLFRFDLVQWNIEE